MQPSSTAHTTLLPQPSLAYGPVVVRMRAVSWVADVLRLLRANIYVALPPGFLQSAVAARAAFPSHCFSTCADAPRWEMAAEWLGAEEAEDAGGSEGPQGRRERGLGPI